MTGRRLAQEARILTDIEVVYTLFLNQAGVDNVNDICAAQEEQAQRLMEEALGRLGVDRTEVGALGVVHGIRAERGQLQSCTRCAWLAVVKGPGSLLAHARAS